MNDDGLPLVRYSTRSTGPCECSATARLPSHSPTNCQTYKPDEGVAPANEQRVASIHHDERVGLTGEGEPHEPGMRTQRHHRRGQLSWPTVIPVVPAIPGDAGSKRHLAVAGHRFSSGGRYHARPVCAILVANQSGAVRRVLPMQLASTAYRSQPVPANVPPAGGLHNPVHPGMAEVRHPPQRRVHEHHRIAGRARHFGCDRHCVRHQTHSMAYAIADSHRFLLVLLRRGRGAMASHPSAYQAVDRLFRAPHVPAVHQ